jgi:hypothetical protein
MPLKLKRRWQFVDALVEHFHHAIVAAIHRDFTDPDRAARFDLHSWIGRGDPGPTDPSKTFPHSFKEPGAIVAPLILIIFANEISDRIPVSVVDRVKEIFGVQPDLMLRPPKPDEIKRDGKDKRHAPSRRRTKGNCHRPALFPADILPSRIGYGFLNDGSTGSFIDRSRSQPSFCRVTCSIAIAFAFASRSGRISYSDTQQR